MKYIRLRHIAFLLVMLVTITACQKKHYFDGGIHTGELNMSIYDFLKSRPIEFDTIAQIVDKCGLVEALKSPNMTFFVPRDISVGDYLYLVKGGAKLDTMNVDTLKNAISKYIIPNETLLRDDIPLTPGGKFVTSVSGYQMFVDTWREAYNGVPNSGPIYIRIWDPHGETDPVKRFDPNANWPSGKNPWRSAGVITSNLKATNGVIHALSGSNIFDFPIR